MSFYRRPNSRPFLVFSREPNYKISVWECNNEEEQCWSFCETSFLMPARNNTIYFQAEYFYMSDESTHESTTIKIVHGFFSFTHTTTALLLLLPCLFYGSERYRESRSYCCIIIILFFLFTQRSTNSYDNSFVLILHDQYRFNNLIVFDGKKVSRRDRLQDTQRGNTCGEEFTVSEGKKRY